MAIYALGMAVPLFILAILWERFDLSHKKWLRGKELKWGPITTNTTSIVSGALFILIGGLFLGTDGTAGLSGIAGWDSQFNAELWATRVGNSSTDLIVLLVEASAAGSSSVDVSVADASAAPSGDETTPSRD